MQTLARSRRYILRLASFITASMSITSGPQARVDGVPWHRQAHFSEMKAEGKDGPIAIGLGGIDFVSTAFVEPIRVIDRTAVFMASISATSRKGTSRQAVTAASWLTQPHYLRISGRTWHKQSAVVSGRSRPRTRPCRHVVDHPVSRSSQSLAPNDGDISRAIPITIAAEDFSVKGKDEQVASASTRGLERVVSGRIERCQTTRLRIGRQRRGRAQGRAGE
jgi:hypothetical protein